MIKNANTASPEQELSNFEIKDSLLGDALERNRLTKPPRLQRQMADEHPLSKPEDHESSHATS